MTPEERKLDKALKFLELSQNDTVTPEELDAFLNELSKVLAGVKEGVKSLTLDLRGEFQAAINRLEDEYPKVKRALSEVSDLRGSTLRTIEAKMNEARATIDRGMKEVLASKPKDGVSPDPTDIAVQASKIVEERLKPFIPSVDDLLKDGGSVRNALERLPEGEKLSMNAIEGLLEALEKIRKIKVNYGSFAGGTAVSGGGKIVKAHDLTDQLNGVLKTFSLPAFWRVVSVHSSSFPYTFRPITDYTVDGGAMTITFTSEIDETQTLATGQTLLVVYAE